MNATSTGYPLVVDLDGTLTPTDTLMESLVEIIRESPLNLARLPIWLVRGRAYLKDTVAARASFAGDRLPYRERFLDYLREEKAKGRQLVLATAAHRSIAESVVKHLGLFDQLLATDATHNLKGKEKLRAIRESVGPFFVYAGDSSADIPIWLAAQAAVLVGVSTHTAKVVRRRIAIEREFQNEGSGLAVWLRAIRAHQWLKNLLLFVPLLTAFSLFDISKFTSMVVAFLAFSLTASATYILNDLWDLDNDRVHPRKRFRPFACARLSILSGLAVSAVGLFIAFLLAFAVSKPFVLVLALYFFITSTYGWGLKKYVLIDVIVLSLLYTIRILAGAVAINISTSSWLLSFSVFMFLSLALVKRCAELVLLRHEGVPMARGRDYRVADLVVLWPLGVGASLSAVVVFGLFINAPETTGRYGTPQLLWFVALGLVYWLARLWIKTSRGEMHDDPVVYAIKDRGSRLTVVAMTGIMLAAHFLSFSSFR